MIDGVKTVRTLFPDPVKSVQPEGKLSAGVQTLHPDRFALEQRPKDEGDPQGLPGPHEKPTIAEEQRIRMIEHAIKSIQGPTTRLDYSVHEKTNDIIIRVVDKETGEVIREIPPEKSLDILSKLLEIAGLLIDERV